MSTEARDWQWGSAIPTSEDLLVLSRGIEAPCVSELKGLASEILAVWGNPFLPPARN